MEALEPRSLGAVVDFAETRPEIDVRRIVGHGYSMSTAMERLAAFWETPLQNGLRQSS